MNLNNDSLPQKGFTVDKKLKSGFNFENNDNKTFNSLDLQQQIDLYKRYKEIKKEIDEQNKQKKTNLKHNSATSANSSLNFLPFANNITKYKESNLLEKNKKMHLRASRRTSTPHSEITINKIDDNLSRSESRNKSNSIIKRLSFKFKSHSADTSEETLSNPKNNIKNDTIPSSFLEKKVPPLINTNSLNDRKLTKNISTDIVKNNFNNSGEKQDKEEAKSEIFLNHETMKKVFSIFDRDQDGSITIEDVQAIMNSLKFLQNEIEMPSIEQIKIAFEKFDENKNGSIEFNEFINILKSAASQNSEQISNINLLKSIDKEKQTSYFHNKFKGDIEINNQIENTYDLNQFQNDFTDLVKSNMKLIFEQFDKDNDGKITRDEIKFVMRNLFPDEEITEHDIDEMLKDADLDNNGFIDFDEFSNLFNLYSKNNAIGNLENEQLYPNLSTSSKTNRLNTIILNNTNSSPINKLEKSNLNKLSTNKLNQSRSNSKEPGKRSRTQSQTHSSIHSASQSPNIANFRKFVQIFTSSQIMDLKAAFTMFDKNGDQKISETELYQVMKYLGVQTTEKEVKAMIQVVDKNRNGYVDYDEFIQMMTQTHIKPVSADEELKKTFNIFDIDGNGYISSEEIKKTMQNLGENLTDEEVRDMIKAADKNGDGKIDINEFSGLLSGSNIFDSNR